MSTNEPVTIDFDKLKSEIAGLDQDKLKEQLLQFRFRQKVQQKKQQGKGSQKAYQAKKNAQYKLMKEEAIRLGIWDTINEEAELKAKAKIDAEIVPADEEAETATAE